MTIGPIPRLIMLPKSVPRIMARYSNWAREFAESLIGKGMEYDYLGKGYSVECLPQYYRQIIWFLTNKLGYIDCLIDSEISYQIEDYENRIIIQKSEKKIETKEL